MPFCPSYYTCYISQPFYTGQTKPTICARSTAAGKECYSKETFQKYRSGTINSLAELLEFSLVAISIQSQTEMKLSDETVTHRNIAQQTQKDLQLSDKTVTYRHTAL